MIDERGCGFSKCGNVDISEWHNFGTEGNPGMQIFIYDKENRSVMNATGSDGLSADDYKVWFSESNAKFYKKNGGMICETEVAVSGEENAELRLVKVTNTANCSLTVEITAFVRLVLNRRESFDAHPSFSDMFVVTEGALGGEASSCVFSESKEYGNTENKRTACSVTVKAMRRKRSIEDMGCFAAMSLSGDCGFEGRAQFDTNLITFLGRGGGSALPQAVADDLPLAMESGTVLYPCFAVRGTVKVMPG